MLSDESKEILLLSSCHRAIFLVSCTDGRGGEKGAARNHASLSGSTALEQGGCTSAAWAPCSDAAVFAGTHQSNIFQRCGLGFYEDTTAGVRHWYLKTLQDKLWV